MKVRILATLYFVSGASALAYEVAWNRMLASTLGAAGHTMAVVLAAFMAGLALGSRLFGGYADNSRTPLKLYAWLEIGIACWAVCVPTLIMFVQMAQRLLYPHLVSYPLLLVGSRLCMAFLVLLIPATFMGGTYPALGRASEGAGSLGRRAAILYAANTVGAMSGAAWAGFDGIARLGLRGTADVAVIGSLIIGIIALVMSRQPHAQVEPSPFDISGHVFQKETRRALFVVFVSGLSMLALEVLWTRIIVAVVATTIYAFSAILVVYLGSVALGSAVCAPILNRVRDPFDLLGLLCSSLGIACIAPVLYMQSLATPVGYTGEALGAVGWYSYLARLFWDVFRLVFPACFISGAMIPVAAHVLSRASLPPGYTLSRVYLWNTIGAMIGAPLATFILIPQIGRFSWVIVMISLLLACTTLLCRRTYTALSAIGIIVVIALTTHLSIPVAVRHHLFESKAVMRYYREGATCTVAIVDYPDYRGSILYVDSFQMAGAGPGYGNMRLLGHLPALLVPRAHTGAVIGFGTGTSAAAMACHPLDTIDIIEISRDVTDASAQLQAVNMGLLQHPPVRPRIHVVYDDAKAWLDAATARYDIIISEPPLPCMAGTANLFSREFYQGVRRCLSPMGAYVQWLPLHGMAPSDGPGLIRTFLDVFPLGMIFVYQGSTVFLVAAPGPLDPAGISEACRRPRVHEELAALACGRVEDIIGSFLVSSDGLASYAGNALSMTDDCPWVEFFSPDRRRRGTPIDTLSELLRHASIGNIPIMGSDAPLWERSRRSNLLILDALSQAVTAVEMTDAASRKMLLNQSLRKTQDALHLDPGNGLAQNFLQQMLNGGVQSTGRAGKDVRSPEQWPFHHPN